MELAKWCKFCITNLFLLLSTHGLGLLGDRCSPHLEFPGYTVPKGDIVIQYGDALDIMCVLNNNTLNSNPNASQNLSFRRNNQTFPKEMVEIVNSTAIRLKIDKPGKVSNDYYVCLYNEQLVCNNLVSVGVPPQDVKDFKCIGYNYESLVCSWTPPQNYIKTNYSLTYHVNSRSRLLPLNCPSITETGENSKNHQLSCYWNISTTPHYRQSHETFYFNLSMTNKFGTNNYQTEFKHFSHVLSGPPENLTVLSATPSSIYLHWEVPHPMQVIRDGVHHRILYSCEYESTEFQQAALIVVKAHEKSKYFNLTNIKHPHSLCEIKVSLRTAKALPNDETMWSKNTTITARTLSRAPDLPPYVTQGSFEVSGSDLQYRDFFVYWGEIPQGEKNGENFRYEIKHQNETAADVKYQASGRSYVTFNLPIYLDHTFYLRSQNDNGSSKPAKLVIPKQSSRFDPPTGFNKMDFENGTFELTWDPLKLKGQELTSYTIFWCNNQKERPSQCSGHLQWKDVPANVTSTSVTVDKTKVFQFAISANTFNSTSGLLWGDCTIMYNKNTGKLQNVRISKIGSNYIELEWKRDCSDRIGPVRGYRINYCKSKFDSDCLGGSLRNFTFLADSSIFKANVTNLTPYTHYMFAITALLIKHNSSSQPSNYVYAETLASAPSLSPNFKILNVTNSTVVLSWEPSHIMNGKFKNYSIEYRTELNNLSLTKDTNDTTAILTNLESYANYSIKLRTCNTELCSNYSQSLQVTTEMGYPDKITKLAGIDRNDSTITITWNPPYRPRGKLDFYVVSIEKIFDRENKTSEYNVTKPIFYLQHCGDDGKYNNFFIRVKAVNKVQNELWAGPWSDTMQNRCGNSFNYLMFALIIIVIIFFIAMAILFNRLYHYCKIMRNVEVKLPPGLAVVQEHALVISWSNENQEKLESHAPPDEELLLIKMTDIRQFSGDSSGSSSGHESMASSLEVGSHVSRSTDSGTEHPTSYCTLGTTDLKIDPSDECDDNSESSPYVMSGETVKPAKTINPGYVAFDQTEPKVKSPTGYVVAGHKNCNGYVVAGVKNVKLD